MGLVPRQNAPTAIDAENALGRLRDGVLTRLQREWANVPWQLALHGLQDGVEDVLVTIRRLAAHESVWRDSRGTRPTEPPFSDNPNQNAMQQMVRGRADLRTFLLLIDVLLDDAVKALRLRGAPKNRTESFNALITHLEDGGAVWSRPLLPLTNELAAVQYSLGYFRDKFVVHRGLLPVVAIYLPDGRIRLGLVGGTKSDDDRARAGRLLADLMPVMDVPLEEPYDFRLDLAFAAMRVADRERRKKLATVVEEFGAVSPDPYEAAIEVAAALEKLFVVAQGELQPAPSRRA
jgi:hypothetical protein